HRSHYVVQLGCIAKESCARPIQRDVVGLRHRQTRTLESRLREREQRSEPVRRCPPCVTRIDENLVIALESRQRLQYLLERGVIQRWWNGDDVRHVSESSPRR